MSITNAMCCVCDQAISNPIYASERMFGLGGNFGYASCPNCGMLTQIDPPADMSPYYAAAQYYSLAEAKITRWHQGRIKSWLAFRRNQAQIFGTPFWAVPLAARKPSGLAQFVCGFTKHAPSNRGLDIRILDVGCGAGELLSARSRRLGFPISRASIPTSRKMRSSTDPCASDVIRTANWPVRNST